MPGTDTEQPLLIRQFRGVNLVDEPAFLDPSYLQACQNFIPAPNFTLAKRLGTTAFLTIAGASQIQSLARAYDTAGNRYLYAYVNMTVGRDTLQVSVNDAAVAVVAGAAPTATGARGALVVLNGQVYAANGVDAPFQIPLGGNAVSLGPLALANDTGQAAAITADANATLLSGSYTYRWAIYDTGTKAWAFIGPVQAFTLATRGTITFTAPQAAAPATVLGANQKWHLFVAPANFPIESAHNQTAGGLAAAATFTLTTVTVSGTQVPIPSTVTRLGRFPIRHRSRVLLGGDPSPGNSRKIYGTSTLPLGLEQQLFDQGLFWPANAVLQLDDDVTGLGVVTLTGVLDNPAAPVALFANNETWLLLGDLLDDPTAQFFKLSDHIGCVAHATIVTTPVGLIFLGNESVYLLTPSGAEPVDIGWPIAPAVRATPTNQRAFALAYYHKNFYKLCLAPAGGVANTTEWWLDLRPRVRGNLDDTPAWTGPHVTAAPLSAAVQGEREPAEDDRAFGAVNGGGTVLLMHQAGSFVEQGVTISSSLRTARMVGADPFSRKRVKRVRALAKVPVPTTVNLQAIADAGASAAGAWFLQPAAAPLAWSLGWNVTWAAQDIFVQGDTHGVDSATAIALGAPFPTEVVGKSIELQLDHAVPSDLALRDVELRVQILERAVA